MFWYCTYKTDRHVNFNRHGLFCTFHITCMVQPGFTCRERPFKFYLEESDLKVICTNIIHVF